MYPTLLGALAKEHQNDLLRDADRDRLARLATATERRRPVRQGRERLGLLLVAAGNRLIPPPGQPC